MWNLFWSVYGLPLALFLSLSVCVCVSLLHFSYFCGYLRSHKRRIRFNTMLNSISFLQGRKQWCEEMCVFNGSTIPKNENENEKKREKRMCFNFDVALMHVYMLKITKVIVQNILKNGDEIVQQNIVYSCVLANILFCRSHRIYRCAYD